MRKEDEMRAKVAECIATLQELAAKPGFEPHDFIIADRNVTTASALLWVLEEQPPDELKKLASSVLDKFRPAS